MAAAILGADRPARNLTSNDIPTTAPAPLIEGLVADPNLGTFDPAPYLQAVGLVHWAASMNSAGGRPPRAWIRAKVASAWPTTWSIL